MGIWSLLLHDPYSRSGDGQGHATDSDNEQGRVRLEDRLGNAEADTAADLRRLHHSELLVDAMRSLLRFVLIGTLLCSSCSGS